MKSNRKLSSDSYDNLSDNDLLEAIYDKAPDVNEEHINLSKDRGLNLEKIFEYLGHNEGDGSLTSLQQDFARNMLPFGYDFLNIQDYSLDTLEDDLEALRLNQCKKCTAKNFILYRGSKNLVKITKIGVDIEQVSGLNLHERQSLAERLIFSKIININDINDRPWPHLSYVIANFGLIVTDRVHKKGGDHKRIFKTIPIKIKNYTITGEDTKLEKHAEHAVYAFLSKRPEVISLLINFRQRYGINDLGHKIYSVILDLHGTYDMCLSCSDAAFQFQENFRKLLLDCFKEQQFKPSNQKTKILPIIIRYSSDIPYDYPGEKSDKKRGLLYAARLDEIYDNLDPKRNCYCEQLDIKNYGANVLIHGNKSWHGLWSNKERQKQYADKQLPLESWTAFVTTNCNKALSEEQKSFNYTRLGLVETCSLDSEFVCCSEKEQQPILANKLRLPI